ncbi:PREDICTED: vegetative cell wall protein gp1-like [Lipotes vexillifer]|uniref:Vegetative cell wall protein gp1-like n=1 Tax=Lipotes vexillifer TaxID=118797 RepID=A0A340Y2E8_LIPVE|nr:PREDICTED: vegetative cell wall protein gp1-like [Lipotes vexillifer]
MRAAPTLPPEGSTCTKHKPFGNLVLQQVAGERRSAPSCLPSSLSPPPSSAPPLGRAPGRAGAASPSPGRPGRTAPSHPGNERRVPGLPGPARLGLPSRVRHPRPWSRVPQGPAGAPPPHPGPRVIRPIPHDRRGPNQSPDPIWRPPDCCHHAGYPGLCFSDP